ncbi:alpha-L-fucosidase [Pelagicoccus sp. SDUM812005]|uniref:alpha-L-fucosidase n=1 Tax=Pelagicoccus sp. SDUM812005 TaxID=3041257 RepID=UPI00280D3691|nr:alpha-L-fucosidase [Pelagicoccus sp. SDUM812005]MDQ8183559.1 alpha-L-fucosidase [Pelagicoccus sp. SDUM812005]
MTNLKLSSIALCCAAYPLLLNAQETPAASWEGNTVDSVVKITGSDEFGSAGTSVYTPEIRENMRDLYKHKFGLFVHWGPYAQLEGIWNGKEVSAEWIMRRGEIPVADYEREAAAKFMPHQFDASEWVDIAEQAGMGFIVLTAKHHDGFAMYDSAHPYDIVDFAGFGRDVFKELSEECAQRGMDLGFYYSQSQDWHEEGGAGNSWDFGSVLKPQDKFDAYFEEKAILQVDELTRNYGDIFMVWFDTPLQMDDEKCQEMMDLVRKNQPGALVNSRLGKGYGHFDVSIDNGKTPSVSKATWLPDLKVPWQTHESVTQRGWGYTSYGGENDRSDEYTEFIYSLCRIVAYGGVYLLNVAPRPDGTIPESQVNSITAIGDWLKVNGEAIYDADPSPLKFPPYAITSKPGKVYLHLEELEKGKVELEGLLSKVKNAYCLADTSKTPLKFKQKKSRLSVRVPESLQQPRVTVVVLEIADQVARVVDETIQQAKDGSIDLPVAKCEYAVRRISYDYEEQATANWGGKTNQGLVWTVNVKEPGTFRIFTEDNGDEDLSFELSSPTETVVVRPGGPEGEMSKKRQGTIKVDQAGVVRITAYPKDTISWFNNFHLKAVRLVPEK